MAITKELENSVGTKINPFSLKERSFVDMVQLINTIRKTNSSMCWGSHAWKTIGDGAFRFAVNGHLFRGHVYVSVGWDDTFNLHFTTSKGTIKKIMRGVYVDELLSTIDYFVETA